MSSAVRFRLGYITGFCTPTIGRVLWAIALTLLVPPATELQATEFYRAPGLHSLKAIFGLPTPIPPKQDRSSFQFLMSGTHANQFSGGTGQRELLLIDGERSEIRFSWFKALRSCLDWGIELPVITHGSGYFDRVIEDWHEWFGLPNANRDGTEPNNLFLLYEYQDELGILNSLVMESKSTAVGDIHVQLIRPAWCGGSPAPLKALSLRLGLKLPSGDEHLLAGSGATDVYLDVTTADLAHTGDLGTRLSVGLLATGNSDVVKNQEHLALFGSAVIGWHYSATLELLAQLDWHTSLFDSDLRELGAFGSQLTFGGRWRRQTGTVLDLALQEDLGPDTVPDVSLYLAFRRQF